MMCEFALDKNDSFMSYEIKKLLWPHSEEKTINLETSTAYKRLRAISEKMIVVKLYFKTPNIESTVLDSRTTLSDKIANFGGTFGIWAELTGVSLLGIINLILLLMKLIFHCFPYQYLLSTSLRSNAVECSKSILFSPKNIMLQTQAESFGS